MLAFRLTQTKDFMSRLLLSNTFDRFLLAEASITTGTTFTVDGHFHPEFYTEEERAAAVFSDASLVYWEHLRPVCLGLIRGKRTPLRFSFVFRLSTAGTEQLLLKSALPLTCADVHGLYLNLRYEQGVLTCTTAASLAVFTLDKALDNAWDAAVRSFFLRQEIAFEEQ